VDKEEGGDRARGRDDAYPLYPTTLELDVVGEVAEEGEGRDEEKETVCPRHKPFQESDTRECPGPDFPDVLPVLMPDEEPEEHGDRGIEEHIPGIDQGHGTKGKR